MQCARGGATAGGVAGAVGLAVTHDWLEKNVRHRHVELGEVGLHLAEAGEGPLVVLLHGFPEHWYMWRYQVPALVECGYHVVAPDMRGYNLSDKPKGIRAYTTDRLTRDIAELVDACGSERASIIAHDWGGAIAWLFAMQYPDKLKRLAVLNCPHPARMLDGLKTLRQLRKSWYMFFFQLPFLPELGLRARRFGMLRRMFQRDPVRPMSNTDVDRYVEALSQPGALTGAINYYRALRYTGPKRIRETLQPIHAPVLVIWGERDAYLGAELAEPSSKWVPNARVVRLPDASHWVTSDAPVAVNRELIAFLG